MKAAGAGIIVALTVACGPTLRGTATPLTTQPAHQGPADWLEPVVPDWRPRAVYYPGRDAVLGNHLTLVAARIGIQGVLVGVHDARGVVGFAERREGVRWIGLDGDDAVYQVDDEGHVIRAQSFEAAMSGSWEERATVAGARIWTTSAGVLGAAVDDTLYVSTDGARTFRATKPDSGAQITFVGTRSDGVVVVQVRRSTDGALRTLRSSDRGEHFSPMPRVPELSQVGAWIFSRCARAVLSSDGKTWVRVDDFDALQTPAISDVQDASGDPEILGASPRVNLFEPRPPGPHLNSVFTGEVSCSGRWVVTQRPQRPREGGSKLCVGVMCLGGRAEPSPYPTRTKVILLHDGACAAEGADTTGKCRPDAPVQRAPHALVLDHDSSTARVIDLPSTCRPGSIRSAGGLSVLSCRESDGSATLYAATRTEPWKREARFRVPLTAETTRLQVAGDGTALFEDQVGGLHEVSAWLRAPVAVGTASAWRKLQHDGARAYSVARGNAALVAVSEWGRFPDEFSLVLDVPQGQSVLLRDSGRLRSDQFLDFCLRDGHVLLLVETDVGFRIETVIDGRRDKGRDIRSSLNGSHRLRFLDDLGLCKGPV